MAGARAGDGVVGHVREVWATRSAVRHGVVAVGALLVLIGLLTAATDYQATVLTDLAYLAIAGGGLTVLTGLNGQISLGHGALMAFGAYTTALLLPDREAGTPLVVVVLSAVVASSVVGLVVGLAAARLRGPYLAGATLALAVAVPGLPLYFKDVLAGGEERLPAVMPEIPIWATDTAFYLTGADPSPSKYIAFCAGALLIVTFWFLANLARSRVGRRWAAVRDDEVAAELAGIHLGRSRVSAFVVSAAAAGAAGSVLAVKSRGVSPESFTLDLSLTLLAAVVIGGLGSLTGALLGSAVLVAMDQVVDDAGIALGLSQIQAAELAPLVYGAVLVAVILLAPRGLTGSVRALRRRRTPGSSATTAVPDRLGRSDTSPADTPPADPPTDPVPSGTASTAPGPTTRTPRGTP